MNADKGVNEGRHMPKIDEIVIPEIRQWYNTFYINLNGTFNIFCKGFIFK